MIRYAFPDLQWLKRKAEKGFSRPKRQTPSPFENGWPNVVLNVKSAGCYRDNIRGPLSLFTNFSGESAVEVEGKRTTIREGFYFISNENQYYTLEIPEKQMTETFNVHFGEAFLDEASASLLKSFDFLLENETHAGESVHFYNRLNYRNERITSLLKEIAVTGNESAIRLEENLYDLATSLLLCERELHVRRGNIKATKESTRKEMMKRMNSAVDFIYENFHRDIQIDDLAAASCLSKFHFLRIFKAVFSVTPATFLEDVRILKAKEKLGNSETGIRDLAAELGYRNASSFSRLFRNRMGLYPSQYRAIIASR